MVVIICVENRNGILFNHRRVSRDAAVLQRIAENSKKPVLISPFSATLFKDFSNVLICENPLDEAKDGDICFIEDMDIVPYLDKISKIILYHWNRDYPADTFLPEIEKYGWKSDKIFEFQGKSHEKITEEEFIFCKS